MLSRGVWEHQSQKREQPSASTTCGMSVNLCEWFDLAVTPHAHTRTRSRLAVNPRTYGGRRTVRTPYLASIAPNLYSENEARERNPGRADLP